MEAKINEIKQTLNIAGKEVTVKAGKIGIQAAGSIILQMGGTTLFATASVSNDNAELDYFPLSVEYIEKMYARGVMSNSKYKKREGLPSDEAIIKARQVDHSVRSLFPKSFKRPVAVVLTVLSYDGENDPEALAVLGASLALMQSGVPFYGPCSSVIACVDDNGEVLINPKAENREQYNAEYIVSAVDKKILNLEGWSKEISEETMDKILDKALEVIEDTNKQQIEFINKVGKTLKLDMSQFDNKPASEALIHDIIEKRYADIKKVMTEHTTKTTREPALKELSDAIVAEFKAKDGAEGPAGFEVAMAVDYIQRKVLREGVLKEEKRISGRKLDEIREITCEVDVLPTVHGSAFFTRGLTQSLSIVTLASKDAELVVEDMEGESKKRFMHHYNMPGYANGEASRFGYYPGRREIGHGAIGENALKNVIADEEVFPYAIRAVSEITSSNGSTSMAATCASSMALMAAGVPMKSPVAGIGVGLVTEEGNEDVYKLLLDIEGIEDFYGDMDFKVCGTETGITAIQYENKLMGVQVKIMKESIRLAKKGRSQVLAEMAKAIDKSRGTIPEGAPKIEKVKIAEDRIGEFIGPSGKHIKELVAEASDLGKVPVEINIDDTGMVNIYASSEKQMQFVKDRIAMMFEEPEIGKVYEGVVDKVVNFGAFVNVSEAISGLLHVSEVGAEGFVKDAMQVLKPNQKVSVKLIRAEGGKLSFSMKGVPQPADAMADVSPEDMAKTVSEMPVRRDDRGGRGFERRDRR